MTALYAPIKRTWDICAGLAGLVATLAVLPMVALTLRIQGHRSLWERRRLIGPDRRVGPRRQPGPDRRKIWRQGPILELMYFRTRWADDPQGRVSPVGRFLARTGVAGLPVSWHLLAGRVSLVGPHLRDEALGGRPVGVDLIGPGGGAAAPVPGLTGLAQLAEDLPTGRGRERQLDLLDQEYLRRRSLGFDATILLFAVLDKLTALCPH